jgi:hypothetical protein
MSCTGCLSCMGQDASCPNKETLKTTQNYMFYNLEKPKMSKMNAYDMVESLKIYKTKPKDEKLANHAIERLKELESKEECPICLIKYGSSDMVFLLKCNHLICTTCKIKLIKCPFCRTDLT